jgi:hypothetical protein
VSRLGVLTRRTTILACAGMALVRPAAAHRALSAVTTVEWNAEARRIEVAHTLHAQDMEVALAQLYPGDALPDLTRPKDQAKLALYVEKHFRLSDPNGAITLTAVGVDLQGQEAVFFREASRAAPSAELVVEDTILRDIFSQQANLVNVRMAKRTRTLIFSGKDGAKRATGLV